MLLCLGDSELIAENTEAMKKLTRLKSGEFLFNYMSAEYVIRYEAAADSDNCSVLPLKLCGLDYPYAKAFFNTVSSRCFVIIALFESEAERDGFVLDTSSKSFTNRLIEFIGKADFLPDTYREEKHLFDLRRFVKDFIPDITERIPEIDLHYVFEENLEAEEMKYLPARIGTGNLMSAVTLMLLAISSLSLDRTAKVKICRFSGDTEIRITANEIISPAKGFHGITDMYLSLCEYIAGVSGAYTDVRRSDDMKKVTLIFGIPENNFDDTDFKSPSGRDLYEAAVRHVASLIGKLLGELLPAEKEE